MLLERIRASGGGHPDQAHSEGEGIVSDTKAIVEKLWNYCNILRDDGLSYGDYVEQLTYLLFLKMADEQTQPPFNRQSSSRRARLAVAARRATATSWRPLPHILEPLGRQPGLLGVDLPQGAEPDPGPGEAASGSIVDLIDSESG